MRWAIFGSFILLLLLTLSLPQGRRQFSRFLPLAPSQFTWGPGKELVYELGYEVFGKVETSHVLSEIPPVHASYFARAQVVVLAQHPLSLRVRFSQERGGTAAPFDVTLSPRGELQRITFLEETGAKPEAQSFALVGLLQFRLPPAGQGEWEEKEGDLNGMMRVGYQVQDWFFRTLVVSKSRWTLPPSRRGGRALSSRGELLFTLEAASGVILAAQGERELEIRQNGVLLGTETVQVNCRLLTVSQSVTPPTFTQKFNATYGPDFGKAIAASRNLESEKALLGNETWSTLEPRLTSQRHLRFSDWGEEYLQLVALLRIHPQTALEVGRSLESASPDESLFSAYSMALAKAGHPQAQEALRAAITHFDGTNGAQVTLLVLLARVQAPTQETEDFLRSLAASDNALRRTATLGLGTLGRHLRDGDPARAQALEALISVGLNNPSDSENLTLSLDALGNLGPVRLEALERFFRHPDPVIRRHAFEAIRFSEQTETEQILSQALSFQEPDADVRAAAAAALGERTLSPRGIERLIAALQAEKVPRVLKALLETLAKEAKQNLEARKEIDAFIEKCGLQELCLFAEGLRRSLQD